MSRWTPMHIKPATEGDWIGASDTATVSGSRRYDTLLLMIVEITASVNDNFKLVWSVLAGKEEEKKMNKIDCFYYKKIDQNLYCHFKFWEASCGESQWKNKNSIHITTYDMKYWTYRGEDEEWRLNKYSQL